MPIRVTWKGPFSAETVMRDYCVDNEERCDFGLYQIYGPHELYSNKKRPGADKVLLYIGMTTDGSTFAGRIKAAGFCHSSEYEVYLGRIDEPENEKWRQDVEDAEKILINRYAPAYNGHGVGDLRAAQLHCADCIIENSDSRMDLDQEVKAESVVYAPAKGEKS